MLRVRSVGLLLMMGVAACGGGANKTIPLPDGGGQVEDLSQPEDGGADMKTRTLGDMVVRASTDLASVAGGPTIVVVSPAPNTDIPYNTMHVVATVTAQSGSFIDASTVVVTLPAQGSAAAVATPLSLSGANQYSGNVDISEIPAGPSTFTVSASDTEGRQGAVVVGYVHDPGPVVTFIQPSSPTAHGSVNVEFLVTDSVHTVMAANVSAGIRTSSDIQTTVTGTTTLHFTGLVTFTNYSPTLDGTQIITVTATNSAGVTVKASKQFTVDNNGPTITFIAPMSGDFVGGVINIQATITDESGVDPSSVLAVFGGNLSTSTTLTPVVGSSNVYSGYFDVRKLGQSYVLPIFSIRASDLLGNGSELGEEIVVDNTPPRLELDPGLIRVGQLVNGVGVECSQLFDPVGKDSANDATVVPQIITLRARVEDNGNNAPGLKVIRVSGIQQSSVVLYAIPVGGKALAVDTDADGYCDDVNPNLVPTANLVQASNQAVAVALAPIAPSGVADYSPPPPVPSPFVDPSYTADCDQYGASGQAVPEPLCLDAGLRAADGSPDITIAIPYTSGMLPAIWTIPPVAATSSQCVGFQFDSLNRLPEGPSCFAVRAQDNAGNTNISPPIELCICHNATGSNCAACNSWVKPVAGADHCTGSYNKATMVDNNTACAISARFPANDFRLLE